jgi:iron complex outermembrane receptor protein
LNLPEVGGQLSAKAFYTRQQSDGYYRNVTLGRTDTGATDVERFGVALLWRPVSRFDLLATVERAVEHSSNDNASLSITGQLICLPYGPPLTAPATECNRRGRDDVYTTFSNRAGPVHNREDALTATATWRPGRFTATAVTGLRSSRELAITDFDASSIDFYDVVRPQRYRQFSQELRLQGPVTRFADVVIGAYYFRSRYSIDQVTNFGPLFQIAGSPASVLTRVGQISRSYAVFGDAVITPLPRLRVTVGGRYTWDRKSIRDELVGQFNIKGEKDWSQFTPKVSVDYHLATDVMAYGSYSKGYRAGGFNGRATTITSATVPYNPETVDTYEAGLKAELANRRLRLNLAAFTSDYRNKQEEVVAATPVGSPDPQETLVVNAATARIRGVEFDGEADVGARLTVRASLGILDASYRRFEQVDAAYSTPTQRVYDDLTGLRLRRAPKLTAGVDVAYRIPVGSDEISLDASYRHVASYATTVATDVGTATYVGPGCAPGKVEVAGCSYVPAANYSNTTAPPADTVDASATYRFQVSKTSLGVSIFVRNLLDNRGLSFALPAAGLFTFGYARPPRSYGVRLSGSF